MSEPVQVFIRVKPDNVDNNQSNHSDSDEDHTRHSVLVPIDDKSIRISPPDGSTAILARRSVPAVDDRIFSYDQILGQDCSQEDVYDIVSHQVRSTVQGYNATIFALGCTGSGKTHTMTGTNSAPGIIPRAISEIFSIIAKTAEVEKDVFFYVRLSFVELYNNTFRNLLDFASKDMLKEQKSDHSPSLLHPLVGASGTTIHRSDKIEVRESQSAGVFLAGHNLRIPVTTAQEAFRLIARGNRSRATGSTQCNDVSSRSHAILTLHVESRLGASTTTPPDPMSPPASPAKHRSLQRSPSKGSFTSQNQPTGPNAKTLDAEGAELRLGKIHLVDLAGSERISMSGVEGDTLLETQNINLSLTALGDVLAALSKNASISANQATGNSSGLASPGKHTMVPVPYRNSKLTHLLKDSLGGNSKTIMLTTVHTSPEYYHQTLVSLKYASRAKKVRNRSLVNRDIIGDSGIHAVSKEIERLKNRLDARSDEFNGLKSVQLRDAKENMELKRRLQEMSTATLSEKDELEKQLSHVIHSQAGELVTQKKKISHLQSALQEELAMSQNKIAEQEKEIIWLKRALDETNSAALQPVEDLERAQRVADAWQTQAKHSQSELEAATLRISEVEAAGRGTSAELRAAAEEIQRLQIDLQRGQQQLSSYETSLSTSKLEKEASAQEAERLKEESIQSSQNMFLLNKTLTDCKTRIKALETALEHSQNELRDLQEAASLGKAEHKRSIFSLKQKNTQLEGALKETIDEVEKQMQGVRDEGSAQLEAAEERWKREQLQTQQAREEVEAMKRRIIDIHGDVEAVTSQREEAISRLQVSLAEAAEENNRLHSMNQQANKVVKGQKKDLASLRNAQAESENKIRGNEDEIARREDETAELVSKHQAAMVKVRKNHEQQLRELHENSTTEISRFRDDISSSLSAQQKVLNEKHIAELARAREEERVESENEWMAKLVALEEALRYKEEELRRELSRERHEEVAQVKEEWGAVLSEQLDAREQQHSVELRKMTAALAEDQSAALRALENKHVLHVQELSSSHTLEMSRMQEEITVMFQQAQEEQMQSLMAKHEQEVQEVRAGQFSMLKETENAYKEEMEELQQSIALAKEQNDSMLEDSRLSHQDTLVSLQQQHQLECEGLKDSHKQELEQQLEKLKKTLVAAKVEEKLTLTVTLSKQHEEAIVLLKKEWDEKKVVEVENELTAAEEGYKRRAAEVERSVKRDVERKWMDRMRESEEAHAVALVEAVRVKSEEDAEAHRKQAEEMLQSAHKQFQVDQHAEELSRQSSHHQALELLKDMHSTEKQELTDCHMKELQRQKLSLQESFNVKINHMKAIHDGEQGRRAAEAADLHDQQLTDELNALQASMQEKHERERYSAIESVNKQHAVELEAASKRHREALLEQESVLKKAHDNSLQLAVQEVRHLLEKLHLSEVEGLKGRYEVAMENMRAGHAEEMDARERRVRVECDEERQRCLRNQLEGTEEGVRETEEKLRVQYDAEMHRAEREREEEWMRKVEEMKEDLFQQHSHLTDVSLEDQRVSLIAEHEKAMEASKRRAEEEVRAVRSQAEERWSILLEEQECEMKGKAEAALESERKRFEDTVQSLQEEHEEVMREYASGVVRDHEEELRDMRERLERELELERKERDAEHARVLKEQEEETNSKLEEMKELLISESEGRLCEQRQNLTARHESALEAQMQQHSSTLAELRELLQEKEDTIEEYKIAAESLHTLHRQNQEHLLQESVKEKLEITQGYETKMTALRDDYAMFLEESKRNSELATEAAVRNMLHDQEVEMLEAQSSKIRSMKEEMSSQHSQHVSALMAEHAVQLEKTAKNIEADTQAQANRRVDELKSQFHAEREASEGSLRAHYKDEIGLLRVEYNRFLEESKQNVTLASEMAMKNTLQAQKAEMAEVHAQSLDELRESLAREWGARMRELDEKHKAEAERTRAEWDAGAEEARRAVEVAWGLKMEHALHLQRSEIEAAEEAVRLKIVSDLNAESESQKVEAKEALEVLQCEFRKTLENSKGEAEREYEGRLREAVQEKVKEMEEEGARMAEGMKHEHDEEVSLLREEYNLFLEEGKRNHKEAARINLEAKLEEQKSEMEGTHWGEMDVVRSTMVAEHALEMTRMMEEQEEYQEEAARKAEEGFKRRLEEEVEGVRGECQVEYEKMLEREVERLLSEREVEQERLLAEQRDEDMKSADDRLLRSQTEAEEWRQKYESQKTILEDELALALARDNEEMQSVLEGHARDLMSLKESFSAEKEEGNVEYEEVISAQVEELRGVREEMRRLLEDKDIVCEELKRASEELREGAEEVRRLEKLLQERDDEVAEVRAEGEEEAREAVTTLSTLRVEHKQAMEEAAKIHSSDLMNLQQQVEETVNQCNIDMDQFKATFLQSERKSSEQHQREISELEVELQSELAKKLEVLRNQLAEEMTAERGRLQAALEVAQAELRKERELGGGDVPASETELSALRSACDLEVMRVREEARGEAFRAQNTHFDEISSLKIQTQREVSETQERVRVALAEGRRKDEIIEAMTLEQRRLQEGREEVAVKAQRDVLELQQTLRGVMRDGEEKEKRIGAMLQEQQQQESAGSELKAKYNDKLEAMAEELKAAKAAASVTSGNTKPANPNDNSNVVESSDVDLSGVRARFTTEMRKKEMEYAEQRVELEACIIELKNQVHTLTTSQIGHEQGDIGGEGMSELIARNEELTSRLEVMTANAQDDGDGAQERRGSESSGAGGNSEKNISGGAVEETLRNEVARLQTELDNTQAQVKVMTQKKLSVREATQPHPHSVSDHDAVLGEEVFREDSPSTSPSRPSATEENDRNVALMSDLRETYDREISQLKDEFQRSLSTQREEMQENYLSLLQKQMANLMGLVGSQDDEGGPKLAEMQSQFASLLEELPDSLRDQLSRTQQISRGRDFDRNHDTRRDADNEDPGGSGRHPMSTSDYDTGLGFERSEPQITAASVTTTATWGNLHPSIRHQNENHASHAPRHPHPHPHSRKENSHGFQNSAQNTYSHGDWDSVSTMAKPVSPNDQLIAAILDGDVQGVRTIVRSRGDSLLSEYWRAISGLHFHGSDRKLIHTLETLVQLGASIDAQDSAGNTVMHKAIQVCTSTSVVAVVKCIVKKGGNPSIRNYMGQCPIHVECSRVRTATSKVISVLLRAGVDPNMPTKPPRGSSRGRDLSTLSITPLHLILQRAMSLATAQHADDISLSDQHPNSNTFDHVLPHHSHTTTYMDDSVASVTNAAGSAHPSKMRVSGRRVWVQAAYTLVKAGAKWSTSMVSQPGHTQLYLFLHAFPPPPEHSQHYLSLLHSALSSGMNPLLEDDYGRSALFVLCEQMAKTPREICVISGDVLAMVLRYVPNGGLGGSDRSGRTVFDLEASLPEQDGLGTSCLMANKELLIAAGTSGGTPMRDHSVDMNFKPPNEQQLRQQQGMMGDEYVVNGVARVNNKEGSSF